MKRALVLAGLLLLVAGAAEGATRWGWLGVRIRDLSEQEMEEISQKFGLREGFGAVILEVIKETPAEASGLRTGDLIVAFSDRPVTDTRTLQRYVAAAGVGQTVKLTVLRREEGRRPVSVRIGLMPEPVAAERVAAEYGFLVRDPESQLESANGRPAGPPAITAVLPRSRAEQAGLHIGDVLLELGGHPVDTLDAVREALLAAGPDGPLGLLIDRHGERVRLVLERQVTR
ncbi:MAG TPA: PDZ domain-containing protein [Methylomirabilota bacterium]|nr:PDZ domain-containing protein [Methylomirabilota bacterium]